MKFIRTEPERKPSTWCSGLPPITVIQKQDPVCLKGEAKSGDGVSFCTTSRVQYTKTTGLLSADLLAEHFWASRPPPSFEREIQLSWMNSDRPTGCRLVGIIPVRSLTSSPQDGYHNLLAALSRNHTAAQTREVSNLGNPSCSAHVLNWGRTNESF